MKSPISALLAVILVLAAAEGGAQTSPPAGAPAATPTISIPPLPAQTPSASPGAAGGGAATPPADKALDPAVVALLAMAKDTTEVAKSTVEQIKWTSVAIGTSIGVIGSVLLGVLSFFGFSTLKEVRLKIDELETALKSANILAESSKAQFDKYAGQQASVIDELKKQLDASIEARGEFEGEFRKLIENARDERNRSLEDLRGKLGEIENTHEQLQVEFKSRLETESRIVLRYTSKLIAADLKKDACMAHVSLKLRDPESPRAADGYPSDTKTHRMAEEMRLYYAEAERLLELGLPPERTEEAMAMVPSGRRSSLSYVLAQQGAALCYLHRWLEAEALVRQSITVNDNRRADRYFNLACIVTHIPERSASDVIDCLRHCLELAATNPEQSLGLASWVQSIGEEKDFSEIRLTPAFQEFLAPWRARLESA